jgi:Tol biopolymer transport system component
MRVRRLIATLFFVLALGVLALAVREYVTPAWGAAPTPTPLSLFVAPAALVTQPSPTAMPTTAALATPIAPTAIPPTAAAPTALPATATPGTLHIIIASPTVASPLSPLATATPTRLPPTATPAASPSAQATVVSVRQAVGMAEGERLAWAQERAGGMDIVLVGDGASAKRLTTADGVNRSPSWSPDGRSIAFTTSRDGNNEIYAMRSDGAAPTRLTNNPANDYAPAWSPDGRAIAFVSNRDGNDELYIMRADGSNQVRLTDSGGFDGQPTWSPDSRWLAFTSSRDRDLNIFIMPAGGGAATRLTTDKGEDRDPAWSPDGSLLAFVSNRSGQFQVYTMKADGGDQRKLTSFAKGAESPVWGPQAPGRSGAASHVLAFVAYTGNAPTAAAAEIHTMRGDGSEQKRLTDNNVEDADPAWYVEPRLTAIAPSPALPTATAAKPAASPPAATTALATPAPALTPSAVEVVVDDKSPQFTRGGTVKYWKEASIGYGNHMYFTYNARSADNWGRWTPKLPQPGKYEVFVYIPAQNATTQKATYTVAYGRSQTKKVVNQLVQENAWVSLGTYAFTAQGGESVTLSDVTGEAQSTKRIGFDAVKWVYRGQ